MTKLLILLLCCTCYSFASQHTHIIPVENYESELQDLGQYTETHDAPVRLIKITKTIAVKIPVPYPVKVIEKVPYPVHVNKPYPVEVPHVVHLPKERTIKLGPHHESGGAAENYGDYQVQESPAHDLPSGPEHSFVGGLNYGSNQQPTALGNDYSQPSVNSYGHEYTSEEGHHYGGSKSYSAIKPY